MGNKNTQHNCPICGKYSFVQDNSFDICKYCGWEDDDDLTGWSMFSNPSGTAGLFQDQGEGIAHSGTLTFAFRYDNQGGYLISPLFTGGDNGIDVSFWYKE